MSITIPLSSDFYPDIISGIDTASGTLPTPCSSIVDIDTMFLCENIAYNTKILVLSQSFLFENFFTIAFYFFFLSVISGFFLFVFWKGVKLAFNITFFRSK